MLRAVTSSVAAYASTALLHQLSVTRAAAACSLLQHSQQLHSSITRDPAYSKHNEDDVEFFTNVLGGRGVVQDAAALEPMNRQASGAQDGSMLEADCTVAVALARDASSPVHAAQ